MSIFNDLNVVLSINKKSFKLTERINSQTKFYFFHRIYLNKFFDLIYDDKIKPENKEEETFFKQYKSLVDKKGDKISVRVNDYHVNGYILNVDADRGEELFLEVPAARFLKLLKDNLQELKFINTVRISEDELKLTLYKLNLSGDNYSIEKIETRNIIAEKGKGLKLDEDLDSFSEFLKNDNIGFFEEYGLKLIREMVFDNFSYEKGFDEIYSKINEILKDINQRTFPNKNDHFKALYYYSFNDYYYYMEAMIKLGQEEAIHKVNPVLTNGKVPSVSDIKTLSTLNSKIIKDKDNRIFRKDDFEIAIELEKEENLGVNGLNIFLETIVSLSKLNLTGYFCDMANDVLTITRTFKISIKTLMERMVREVFYNNIRADEYLRYIVDYIEMCKILKIKVDEKLPKDVVRRHDLLVFQMKDVLKNGNSKMDKDFKVANDKNIALLKYAPVGTNFKIYCPESISDLVEKGFKANHCVGSYSDRIINGSSKIFFVEEEGVDGAYFTTFELNKNNELIQAKGFSNITPRTEVMKFIKNFVKNINNKEEA